MVKQKTIRKNVTNNTLNNPLILRFLSSANQPLVVLVLIDILPLRNVIVCDSNIQNRSIFQIIQFRFVRSLLRLTQVRLLDKLHQRQTDDKYLHRLDVRLIGGVKNSDSLSSDILFLRRHGHSHTTNGKGRIIVIIVLSYAYPSEHLFRFAAIPLSHLPFTHTIWTNSNLDRISWFKAIKIHILPSILSCLHRKLPDQGVCPRIE